MRYQVSLTKKAKKQLSKLSKKDQERVVGVLERACIRPRRYATQLSTNKYFRLRAGSLRMIIDIQDSVLVIMVIEVDKRNKIYK